MSRVMGAQCRLTMGAETVYGTAPGGNWKQLGFIEADLGDSQDLIDNPIIGLAANRDPGDPFLGEINTTGFVVVPLNHEGFGHWLRLIFGAPTTTGSPSDYVHHFDSGTNTPPSNAIQLDYTSTITDRYSISEGVRAADLQIDFSPTGPATARIGLISAGERRETASEAGTPAVAAGANFNRSQGSIKRGGSALAQVVGASITYSNSLEAVRTIRADRRIEGADPGIAAAFGEVRLRMSAASETLRADAEAGTPFELDLRLEATAARYLNFNLGRVFLSDARNPITGPQGIEVTFNWRAALDSGDARMMRVTLANGVSSYA